MSAHNLHVPIIHLGTSSALEQTSFRDYDDADDDDDDDDDVSSTASVRS